MTTETTQLATRSEGIVATLDVPDDCRNAMSVFRDNEDAIASLLGPQNAVTLAKVWLYCARTSEKLRECSPGSLASALMTCAELRLFPGRLGHVYFLPFGNECTPIVGYKGYLELARRSGEILEMVAGVVYRDELKSGLVKLSRVPAIIEHPFIPSDAKREDADIVAAYCLIRTKDGGSYCEILDRWQIEERRQRSPSKNSSHSPWKSDYARMARKSAIRALMAGGAVPMSAEMRQAVQVDAEHEVIEVDVGEVEAQPTEQVDPLRAALDL